MYKNVNNNAAIRMIIKNETDGFDVKYLQIHKTNESREKNELKKKFLTKLIIILPDYSTDTSR